ncbi:hypothetical protein PVL29_018847 [Vitis rotundifolia]|uniref:DUF4283 domain-containing protein n=1 Tax=Vitis rotundifolia TaxID=103349 RepID=A0AA39DFI8_VITRO|nr:hypothetical protein PVL29_018847 [Vitis rotundifolia]
MGTESLGFFREGLIHCIKDAGEGKWGREWEEKGRLYSLMRGVNKAGWYLRLGVADSERKRFSIFILKGRGDKGGWVTMEEKLQKLEGVLGRKADKQQARAEGKSVVERSYVEVLKRTSWRTTNSVRLKIEREETLGNLQKLENCIVASWNPKAAGEEDLEKLGRLWAASWALKGNLGLARLERNRALLEFEILEEARSVVSSGNRLLGGFQLGLEHWNPRSGCRTEEEASKEVWVRIVGLPISLWTPTILRRWARILVKTRGGFLSSVLEAEIEEEVYILFLWWEFSPVLRRNMMGCSQASGRKHGEIRGDVVSRAGMRTLPLPVDLMGAQESGLGWEIFANRTQVREWVSMDVMGPGLAKSDPSLGPKDVRRSDGPALSFSLLGSNSLKRRTDGNGVDEGPSIRRRAEVLEGPKLIEGLVRDDPVLLLPQALSKGI